MDDVGRWWMALLATLVAPISWGGLEKDGSAPAPDVCNSEVAVCEPEEEVYGSLEPGG